MSNIPDNCPISGLPIHTRPEWTDVSFGNNYSITLRGLGNNIIIGQHSGYVTQDVVKNVFDLVDNVIAEVVGPNNSYVYIQDYSKLKAATIQSRRYYISKLETRVGMQEIIFFGVSPMFRMSINLAKRLNFFKFNVQIVADYSEAVKQALRILGSDPKEPDDSPTPDIPQSTVASHREDKPQKSELMPSPTSKTIASEPSISPQIQQYIDDVLAFLGNINWEISGDEIIEEVNSSHPFRPVFEAIKLIKSDIGDLTRERIKIEEKLIDYKNNLEEKVRTRTEELSRAKMQAEEALVERKSLEAKLLHVQKMDALGALAGGIAHDFNNILTIIIGNIDLALYNIPERNPARNNVEKILKASNRAKDLVTQILAFTRQTDKKTRSINIIQATEDSLELLRSVLPTSIEVRKKFELVDGFILADPTQFHQLLINLCTNAAQAMLNKGTLEVSIAEVDIGEDDLANQIDRQPGKYIRLGVSDTGEGIKPAIIDKIFDPFFTTREVGQGTGMGLSVVHGIIESHGGFITVESKLAKGSTFFLFFPKTEEVPIEKMDIKEPLPTGNERILFVDDEKALVETGRDMLEHLGYSVTAFTNSAEALEAFKSEPKGFDLVITDMTMPGLTGVELSLELLKLYPSIPIILCTGYSSLISKEDADKIGIREFCMKPLDISQLANTVRKVLNEN
jgi:signal transduction histidine kinase/ActR/RegA family two-component response regulator